jgi:hypothetical protein
MFVGHLFLQVEAGGVIPVGFSILGLMCERSVYSPVGHNLTGS